MPQALNSKEASLFRQVIRHYDGKQYKKGVKAADQILRKAPNHADTLAMKALIINAQGNSDEAFALAKVALRNDMKSYVCWHVYGLLYKAQNNFEEAMKAYKFALKLEPESQQIQRDLAMLQIQMRDYEGYIASRRSMLQTRPSLRQNWTALAVANHLAGHLATAEGTLSSYEDTLKVPPPKTDQEHAEAVLYKNTIIAEMGETERALEHLEATKKAGLDHGAVMEMRAEYLLKLGRKDAAAKAYRALIDRNPEKRAYFAGLEACLSKNDPIDRKEFQSMYDDYAEKLPRADAVRRVPLEFLDGDDFRQAADKYLQRMLNKGVPSTFANIKALYADDFKKRTIETLAEGYVATPKSLDNGDTKNAATDKTSKFETSALYFLAQHYDYYLSRDLDKALSSIDKAIEIQPKSVDFHMTRARIWKHFGDLRKASDIMEGARALDEKDRYINTKAAKYQLRNDENDAALTTMSKFTKNETIGGPLGDLVEMQCVWYLNEDGASLFRQGKYGLALKRLHSTYRIFEIWEEDQYDFHSFSLRKGQIRAYVEMVRWEDRLREHPFYTSAALNAIKIYLLLNDDPKLAQVSQMNGTSSSGQANGVDAAERRKAIKKAKKEQQKQSKIQEERKDEKKPNSGGAADGETKKEDPDPTGIKLVETKEPLKEAMKFLVPLLQFSPKNISSQNIGFEVYFRRKKYLLALKCLLAAHELDPEDPTLHSQIVRLKQTLDTLPSPLPEKVATVITPKLATLTANAPLKDFAATYHSKHHSQPRHLHAVLRVAHALDLPTAPIVDELVELARGGDGVGASLETLCEGDRVLVEVGVPKETRGKYRVAARGRWPRATYFAEGE